MIFSICPRLHRTFSVSYTCPGDGLHWCVCVCVCVCVRACVRACALSLSHIHYFFSSTSSHCVGGGGWVDLGAGPLVTLCSAAYTYRYLPEAPARLHMLDGRRYA